jgi:hypothetical protein
LHKEGLPDGRPTRGCPAIQKDSRGPWHPGLEKAGRRQGTGKMYILKEERRNDNTGRGKRGDCISASYLGLMRCNDCSLQKHMVQKQLTPASTLASATLYKPTPQIILQLLLQGQQLRFITVVCHHCKFLNTGARW